MMSNTMKTQSIIIAEAEGSCGENRIKQCSNGIIEADKLWPFRLKLTTDHIRWDSLKVPPSEAFEEHILANLDEASRKRLDAYIPIELHIADADACETYKVKLVKKDSFWFEPLPDVGQKKQISWCHKLSLEEETSTDTLKSREEFAYSVEPFRHIMKKRNLSYNQEIGFRWSGSKGVIKFDFSILYAPWSDSYQLSQFERVELNLQTNKA